MVKKAFKSLHVLNHTLFRSQWILGASIFIVQSSLYVRLKTLVLRCYLLKDFGEEKYTIQIKSKVLEANLLNMRICMCEQSFMTQRQSSYEICLFKVCIFVLLL